jgi:hypothetical protein
VWQAFVASLKILSIHAANFWSHGSVVQRVSPPAAGVPAAVVMLVVEEQVTVRPVVVVFVQNISSRFVLVKCLVTASCNIRVEVSLYMPTVNNKILLVWVTVLSQGSQGSELVQYALSLLQKPVLHKRRDGRVMLGPLATSQRSPQ